ncbi:hypothetical protein NL676_015698 [Syzygium grande]|nr:hypothetical protein NL676_015698 [Syzygium grande]
MPSPDHVPKLVLAPKELRQPEALVESSHLSVGLCLTLVKNIALTHFLAFFIRVFMLCSFFAGVFFSFEEATFSTAFFLGVALAEVFTAFITGFNSGFLAAFLFTPVITFGFAAALGLAATTAFSPWELLPSTKEKKCRLPTSPPSSYVKGGQLLLGLCLTPFWALEASIGRRRRRSGDPAIAIDLPPFTGELLVPQTLSSVYKSRRVLRKHLNVAKTMNYTLHRLLLSSVSLALIAFHVTASLCAYPTIPGADTGKITSDLPSYDESMGSLGQFLWLAFSLKNGSLTNNSEMKLPAHTGTHVDAPGHVYDHYYEAGFDVDTLDLEVLNGPALLVDVPRDKNLTAEVMESLHIPKGVRRVLFRTLNTDRRLMHKTEVDTSYVGFMRDGAKWLVENTDIKLVGTDYLSVAAFDDLIPAHLVFLESREIILVEALKLEDVPAGLYTVHCLPLRLLGAEGSPIRCILIK